MIVKVTLPWPADQLGQNARVHWTQKAKITKAARYDAKLLTKDVLLGACPRVSGPLEANLYFYPPDKKRYDVFNLADKMKASLDGIFDALGADDYLICSGRSFRCGIVHGGKVVIEIKRLEG